MILTCRPPVNYSVRSVARITTFTEFAAFSLAAYGKTCQNSAPGTSSRGSLTQFTEQNTASKTQ